MSASSVARVQSTLPLSSLNCLVSARLVKGWERDNANFHL